MATLEGQTPAATFKDLLQVMNANSGIDGTLRPISDGEGTISPLELSTLIVRIAATAALTLATGATIDLNGETLVIDTDGDLLLNALVDDILAVSAQGNEVFRVDGSVASPVNGLETVASSTTNPVILRAFGNDTNISIDIQPKGTGSLILFQFFVFDDSVPSSVNGITFKSSAAGNAPSVESSGADTDIDLLLDGKGTGIPTLPSGKLQSTGSELSLNPTTGNVRVSGITSKVISATTNINSSLEVSSYFIATAGGNRTLTLQSSDIAIAGRVFFVFHTDGVNLLTIATQGAEDIDGFDTANFPAIAGVTLISDGSNLFTIG